MSSITYRPEIDGLRAVAVLGVVIFHFAPSLLPGGFLGVDVFFVISGFLIASIVLKERAEGTFSYVNFWARRIRRILPALLFMVGVTMLVGWLILFPPNFKLLAQQSMGTLTFHANHVILGLTNGYWGNAAESLPLLHTWSLAVEEQFYVLFPLFIALLLKLGGVQRRWITVGLVVAGFAGCVALTMRQPAYAFYLLPARAWEMGVGVGLAIFTYDTRKPSMPSWVTTFAAIGILASFLFLKGEADFPGWRASIPVFLAGLFIYASTNQSSASALLAKPGPVLVGKASYSLYLWHWPVIVLIRQYWGGASLDTGMAAFAIVITAVLTTGSYLYVENWGRRLRRPYLFAGISTAALFSASALAYKSHYGQTEILPEYAVEWRGFLYDSFKSHHVQPSERFAGVNVISSSDSLDASDGVGRRFGAGSKRALVIGDSHALAASSVLERVLMQAGYSGAFMVADGCRPIPSSHGANLETDEALNFIEKQKRYVELERPNLIVLVVRQDNLSPVAANALFQHVSCLANIASARVLVMEQPPLLPIGDVSAPSWFSWYKTKHGKSPHMFEKQDATSVANRSYFARAAKSNTRCLWFGTSNIFHTKDSLIDWCGPTGLYYIDDDHLSEAGGKLVEPALQEFISQSGL